MKFNFSALTLKETFQFECEPNVTKELHRYVFQTSNCVLQKLLRRARFWSEKNLSNSFRQLSEYHEIQKSSYVSFETSFHWSTIYNKYKKFSWKIQLYCKFKFCFSNVNVTCFLRNRIKHNQHERMFRNLIDHYAPLTCRTFILTSQMS